MRLYIAPEEKELLEVLTEWHSLIEADPSSIIPESRVKALQKKIGGFKPLEPEFGINSQLITLSTWLARHAENPKDVSIQDVEMAWSEIQVALADVIYDYSPLQDEISRFWKDFDGVVALLRPEKASEYTARFLLKKQHYTQDYFTLNLTTDFYFITTDMSILSYADTFAEHNDALRVLYQRLHERYR